MAPGTHGNVRGAHFGGTAGADSGAFRLVGLTLGITAGAIKWNLRCIKKYLQKRTDWGTMTRTGSRPPRIQSLRRPSDPYQRLGASRRSARAARSSSSATRSRAAVCATTPRAAKFSTISHAAATPLAPIVAEVPFRP